MGLEPTKGKATAVFKTDPIPFRTRNLLGENGTRTHIKQRDRLVFYQLNHPTYKLYKTTAPTKTRTWNHSVRSAALYQLSYGCIYFGGDRIWTCNLQIMSLTSYPNYSTPPSGEWGDSNPQSMPSQSTALTDWATFTTLFERDWTWTNNEDFEDLCFTN